MKLVSEREAAKFLGLSVKTLQMWRVSGKGPEYFKLTGAVRYDLDALPAWVNERGTTSTTASTARQAAS